MLGYNVFWSPFLNSYSFLLKTKGIEVYTVKKDAVNLNFDKEKSNKIHYTVIRAAAIGVPEYKFKLQDGRIYIEIPLNLNNNSIDGNHYIFKLTKFLENF